jgi:acyl-ACP thioesterase
VTDFVPLPTSGRRFTRTRPVRLGDSSPGGRLRFDALARYLQDVSNDDTRDAAFENDMAWVVRRAAIHVQKGARFTEELTLTTFASGAGRSWAERRVSVTGSQGAAIEATSLWVHLTEDGRPRSLPDEFFRIYGAAIGDRKVSAKLTHGDPRPDARVHSWPLRFTDFDLLDHMNNAAYWSAVEEELSRRRDLRPPMLAEVEFRVAIEPGDAVEIHTCDSDDTCEMWMVVGSTVHASAFVSSPPAAALRSAPAR